MGLFQKKLIKIIKIEEEERIHIIKWNNKYTLSVNNGLKVIDIENGEVVSVIKSKIDYIKKIYHPIYGESIITGDKKFVSLWTL